MMRRYFIGLLICGLMTSSISIAGGIVGGRSIFNASEIRSSLDAYLNAVSDRPLNGADRLSLYHYELAKSVAAMIGALDAGAYNGVIAHLAADYRQRLVHRVAIEQLFQLIEDEVSLELRGAHERNPLYTVLDDTFKVWTAVYALGVGRGLLKTGTEGLRGFSSFKNVLANVVESLPRGKGGTALIVGIGTSVGVVHAVCEYTAMHKIDPSWLLANTQEGVVLDIGLELVRIRNELRTNPPNRSRMAEMERTINLRQKDLEELFPKAPVLQRKMRVIAEDVLEVRHLLSTHRQLLDRQLVDALR